MYILVGATLLFVLCPSSLVSLNFESPLGLNTGNMEWGNGGTVSPTNPTFTTIENTNNPTMPTTISTVPTTPPVMTKPTLNYTGMPCILKGGGACPNATTTTLNFTLGNIENMTAWFETPFSVLVGIVILVPIVVAIGGVVAAIASIPTGGFDADKVTRSLSRVGLVLTAVFLFVGIANGYGWKLYGMGWMQDVLAQVWNWLANLSTTTFNQPLVKTGMGITGLKVDTSSLPVTNTIFDAVLSKPQLLSYVLTSTYPLLFSVFTISLALFYKLNHRKIAPAMNDEQNRFQKPHAFNFPFVIFAATILIVAFMYYLSYSVDAFINYQNIGFFSLYLIVTIFCSILLATGIGSPTQNSKQSVFGVIFGVMLLFAFQNLFTQQRTLNVLTVEYSDLTAVKILNTFLFVAPTESLLFHIFLPSLVVFYYLNKNRGMTDAQLEFRINALTFQLEQFKHPEKYYEVAKNLGNLKKQELTIQKTEKELHRLKLLQIGGIKQNPSQLTEMQTIIVGFWIVAFNVLFSLLHWFKSSMTFENFWVSGLGFIYLSAGVIISLIGYRYGWFSAILTHAIYNSAMLMIMMLMTGV